MIATTLIIGIGGSIAMTLGAIGYEPETPLWTGDKDEIYLTLRFEMAESENRILTRLARSDQVQQTSVDEMRNNRLWVLRQHHKQTQALIYMNIQQQQFYIDKGQSIPTNLFTQKAGWEEEMSDMKDEIDVLESLLAPESFEPIN